jgi:hypothetical protein
MSWLQDKADEITGGGVQPAEAVEALADAAAKKFPGRTGKAIWMDVEGRDDEGITLKVYERRATSLDLLMGRKSVGGAVFHRVQDSRFIPTSRVEVSVGVGAAYWFDEGDWSPVAGVKLRF